MPKGGKIIIETQNVNIDEYYNIHHVSLPTGAYVQLNVSDTGIGINKKDIGKIFEPFYTTKEIGKGTGLGLSTVYGIVKQCGGDILVYSEPQQGTTFRIYFPSVKDRDKTDRIRLTHSELLTGNETILVVEDDIDVRELIVKFLTKYNYNVLEAGDVETAIKSACNHSNNIHLLITDVVMPVMSGRDLSDNILQNNPDLKVLFVSGYTDDVIMHHNILDENVNFLAKPFGPEDLIRKVREVLDSF